MSARSWAQSCLTLGGSARRHVVASAIPSGISRSRSTASADRRCRPSAPWRARRTRRRPDRAPGPTLGCCGDVKQTGAFEHAANEPPGQPDDDEEQDDPEDPAGHDYSACPAGATGRRRSRPRGARCSRLASAWRARRLRETPARGRRPAATPWLRLPDPACRTRGRCRCSAASWYGSARSCSDRSNCCSAASGWFM